MTKRVLNCDEDGNEGPFIKRGLTQYVNALIDSEPPDPAEVSRYRGLLTETLARRVLLSVEDVQLLADNDDPLSCAGDISPHPSYLSIGPPKNQVFIYAPPALVVALQGLVCEGFLQWRGWCFTVCQIIDGKRVQDSVSGGSFQRAR